MKRLILFCFLIMPGLAAVAQEKTAMSPMDVADLRIVTAGIIADDGSRIACQVAEPSDPTKENKRAEVHLYVVDVASGRSVPYYTLGSVSSVQYRPRHASITFLTKGEKDDGACIYEVPLGGGEAVRLFTFRTSIQDYNWHPGGDRLVFVAAEPKEKPAPDLPYQPEIYEEDLTFSGAWVADLSGGEPQRVAFANPAHVYHALWNGDGSKLAVSAAPSPLIDDSYTSQLIHVFDASLKPVRVVDHKAKLGEFTWSPDGREIAFIGGEDQHDPIDGRVLVVNASSGAPRLLARDFKGCFDDIEWSDAGAIHFLASEGVKTTLGTLGLDGRIVRIIDRGDVAFHQFSRAGNKAMALCGSTAQHPAELFYLKPGTNRPVRKTDSNPWLANRLMAPQEIIRYAAADGLEIEGILIRPLDEQKGKAYPLITVVHGGPEAHYDNGWLTYYSMPGQLGAGLGYAVFYPNYRGSTGRGIEFAKSSQGDPGGKEFDDVIAGIDHLVQSGLVDKAKVGVTGGSYGGYATAWMSTRHTERFAAGVMFVGISNNLSKWGTSDIPEEMFLVHSRKRIWDDYAFFLERSPIYYAGQAKTPLLIMAGKEDTRVNPEQSYELYRHIKTRTNTPVRLVIYPGEGHGNRNATARLDYNLRMMRWFNQYLKKGDAAVPSTRVMLEPASD